MVYANRKLNIKQSQKKKKGGKEGKYGPDNKNILKEQV